MASDRVITEHI